MKATFTALALAASLLGGAASAQDALSMLELSAARELREYGYGDVDVMTLTLSQLAGIKAVTSSSDYSGNERERQIGVILAN